MASGDSLARDRGRGASTILADIQAAAARGAVAEAEHEAGAEPPEGDRLVALPQPGDPYEAAHARPGNKPVPTLRFVMGATVRGLPYANLDSIDLLPGDQPGAGPAIVLVFTGIIPRQAVLTGRHLVTLFDLLSYHRVAWVRELPKGRDFQDGKATVITGITIERITEMPA